MIEPKFADNLASIALQFKPDIPGHAQLWL